MPRFRTTYGLMWLFTSIFEDNLVPYNTAYNRNTDLKRHEFRIVDLTI